MSVFLRIILVVMLTFPSSLLPPQPQRSSDASFSRLLSGDAPVAVGNSYATDEDVDLVVDAPGVLGNDTDAETDPLTAVLVSDVSNGILILDSDGGFTYIPDENYAGSDSFTYAADDGTSQSNTVSVTISVAAVNDPPTGTDDVYELDEDTILNVNAAAGVLSNDTDPDDASFTAVLVDDVAFGVLTLSANGSFTYDPDPNFEGFDSFTYQADDGTDLSEVITVDLTVNAVNDVPTATADTYGTTEDTPINTAAPGVLANDNDVDGDTLEAVLVSGPTRGSLTLNANGSFVYTPNLNINGSDSFTYRASDGTAVSTPATTVSINITAVNDRPVAVNDNGYSVAEDGSLSVPAATGVLNNDTDPENSPLTANLVSGTTNGTLNLSSNGAFTYSPVANFHGTDTFTYRAYDGALDSATAATVTISVTSVNDRPVAVADSNTIPEDTPVTVPASGVLANDTDIDADPLTAVLGTGPSQGTLTLNANGGYTYTPALNANGAVTFSYYANDNTINSLNPATVTINITPVNDAPVAANDSYTTAEDTPLTVAAAAGLLDNDDDVDNTSLSVVLVAGPSSGSLDLNGDGSFTYTPNPNANGADSFTYRASDGTAQSTLAATVTINVTEVNDRPTVANDSYSTAEDTPLTIAAPGVLSNDGDVDGNSISAQIVSQPANGSVVLNSDGSFTFTPSLNFAGSTSFTYRASDGNLTSLSNATVSITVNADNDRPVAVADEFSTAEDTALNNPAYNVLSNDTDVEGSPLTAQIAGEPSHGTVTLNPDGTFVYTPEPNFSGSDSFTYRASDGDLASTPPTTVTISIIAMNDLPTVGNDAYSTAEDTPLTVAAPGVLANDGDVEGNSLTAVLPTQPANGAVSLNTNGAFTYTPNLNFNGTDTFTYRANDGAGNSLAAATVTITVSAVNDPPVGVNDTYSTSEDTTLAEFEDSVLENDTDPEGSSLTAELVSAPASGTLTLYENGTFTYTPAANFHGQVTFTYTTRDGAVPSLAPATVTITVTPVNDAPVAVADSGSVTEDTPLVIAAPGVLANDTDVDGDALTTVLETQPAHGTLALAAGGGYTYTPEANFDGSDSFTYRCNDGATNSAAAVQVSFSFISVDDPPEAVNDTYATPEDTTLTVGAPGVLENDDDIDGDPLTAELALGPAHGTLALDPDGSFTYTPNLNFTGEDTFTYNANDGTGPSVLTATVTITIEARNDAPEAANDAYTTAEDMPLTVAAPGVLGNDEDIDEDDLTAVIGTPPASGTLTLNANGSFTYTPALNFNGDVTFTYYANDGTTNSAAPATVTLTVTAVNDLPVAVNDAYTTAEDTPLTVAAPGVLANDTDVEGDSLNAVLVAAPASGTLTLAADGSFTYTPALNFNGDVTFTYRANDGTGSSELAATVTITVTADNDLAVAVADSYTTAEDTALTVAAPGVLSNDTDEEDDTLTAQLVTGPAHGTFTLSADGSFTYTPALNYNGPDSFTYTASDAEGASEAATVTITVTAVNDAPVAAADTYAAIDEDTVLTVPVSTGVLSNDTDVENDPLTAEVVTAPAHGTLTLSANGSFTYTPALNYNGPDSFVYIASDGDLESEETTVSLAVNAINDAPVANAGSPTTPEDTALAITLTASDEETPAGLTFAVIDPPDHGALTGTAPNLTYTPDLNYNGPDSFTFQATDPGALASNIATISITVTPVNDAPSAANDAYTTAEDTPVTVALPGVLLNDSDIELSPLNAVVASQPGHGTLTLSANGSFTYTPALNFHGSDTFTYFANDGSTNSTVAATVTVTVTPVNDAPVGVLDNYTTAEDTPINLTTGGVLANDTDVDGDTLTAQIAAGPAHGTVTLQANGLFLYTPQLNYFGPDSFTYRVNDGTLSVGPITVNLNITPVNDAPRTFSKYYQVSVGGELIVPAVEEESGLLEDAMDVENDAYIAQIVAQPARGSVTINPDGSFTYFTQLGSTEDDSFTFRACETVSLLCGTPSTVTIDVVNAVDDIQINFISPVTNNRRWRMGTENITLKVDITNCDDCGVRYYRWDAVSQHYVELATVHEDTTYTFSSTILNAGWDYSGWNQVMAIAVLPEGGLASNRQYIWLIRLPYEGPATRVYIPLGAGK